MESMDKIRILLGAGDSLETAHHELGKQDKELHKCQKSGEPLSDEWWVKELKYYLLAYGAGAKKKWLAYGETQKKWGRTSHTDAQFAKASASILKEDGA